MQSEQKHILVMDDEPDIVEFLQELLEQEGYSVSNTVKSDYLETLRNGEQPDLILLDVFLAGKDGRDIVRHLKGQEETRRIPVIMFSAHLRVKDSSLAAGADDFIAKPFEIDELLDKVAEVLKVHY